MLANLCLVDLDWIVELELGQQLVRKGSFVMMTACHQGNDSICLKSENKHLLK